MAPFPRPVIPHFLTPSASYAGSAASVRRWSLSGLAFAACRGERRAMRPGRDSSRGLVAHACRRQRSRTLAHRGPAQRAGRWLAHARRAITRTADTAVSRRSRRPTRRTCASPGPSRRACCAGTKASRSSSATRCTSITPYPNVAYALDLTQPGFPLKWKYRPENAQAAIGIACCDVVNRGAAFADGKIVYNLLDGHTVAVDAATGTELWRTKMGDINKGETITMAPIVVKNKVIVGSSGGEMGVRGWIAALDLATGKQLWRATTSAPTPT